MEIKEITNSKFLKDMKKDELKDLAKDGINVGKDQLLSALDGKIGEKISGRNTSISKNAPPAMAMYVPGGFWI